MKTSVCIAVLAILITVRASASNERTVLRHLWYEGGAASTVVTLECDPATHYVIHHKANGAVIGLQHAVVSAPLGEPTLAFSRGFLQSVRIRQSGSDSVTIDASYRGSRPLDIHATRKGTSILLEFVVAAPVPAAKPENKVVDIGAMARTNEPAVEQPAQIHEIAETPRTSVVLIIGLVLVAAGLTLGIVAWYLHRHRKQIAAPEPAYPRTYLTQVPQPGVQAEAPAPESIEEVTLLPAAITPEDEPMAEEVQDAMVVEDEEDPAISMARTMQRGKGEVELARRIATAGEAAHVGEEILRLCGPKATHARRVRAAKRLRIGQGEIDLALRLKEFQEHAKKGKGESRG